MAIVRTHDGAAEAIRTQFVSRDQLSSREFENFEFLVASQRCDPTSVVGPNGIDHAEFVSGALNHVAQFDVCNRRLRPSPRGQRPGGSKSMSPAVGPCCDFLPVRSAVARVK